MKPSAHTSTPTGKASLKLPVGTNLNPSIENIIALSVLLYLPFHLLEEWAFGFPAWAETYWRIPNYTTAKWVFHNVYFSAFLLSGLILYRLKSKQSVPFGLGIVCWGLMNALNHLICSIVFLEYQPGMITGLLWIPLTIGAYRGLRANGLISPKLIAKSFLVAVVMYWAAPMVLFIYVDKMLGW